MKKLFILSAYTLLCFSSLYAQEIVFPGADEITPSKSLYFSWINNTNEGATEEQTMTNLAFFEWLNKTYGMQLDIYSFDAGAIDGKRFYGSTKSQRFKRHFPNGFDPIYNKAKDLGIRLGIWGGPDGFGDSKEEAQKRHNQMVGLCKDYDFALFKFDLVGGPFPTSKEDLFIKMMKECRKYSPDLILLNHRLGLNTAKPYATTFLWEGVETYIDVFTSNNVTAPHHRAGAISRGLPPELFRLTEDCGVCISSCLDYWEDDLVLQAFNRSLILAPEIYGNPWLLRDDEFSQMARLFNLHRNYKDILINGKNLPESYGPNSVTRGDGDTRILTFRNLDWDDKSLTVSLNEEIGLDKKNEITLVQLHPTEKMIGKFNYGDKVIIEVAPFRSYMLLVTNKMYDEPSVDGINYRVVKDVSGMPKEIDLLGMPGETSTISIPNYINYKEVTLNGQKINKLLLGGKTKIQFPGVKLKHKPHRKLANLKPTTDEVDINALYEATVFAADNNALEVRSIERSGNTKIKEVNDAREAFFNQKIFIDRGIWDKNLFDDNFETGFWASKKYDINQKIKGGTFRLDLGRVTALDFLILYVPDDFSLQPLLTDEGNHVEVSTDLKSWETITYLAGNEMIIHLEKPVRYLRFKSYPQRIVEIKGFKDGSLVDRSDWRASNLFAHSDKMIAQKIWKSKIKLDEININSYLSIALNGKHGVEGAYAAAIIDGELVGAPDRAVSYPSNTWEYVNSTRDSNYTYYIPLQPSQIGKEIEVFVMGYDNENLDFKPEVWISTYPFPYETKTLKLAEK